MIPFGDFLDDNTPMPKSEELLRRTSLLQEVSLASFEPDERLLERVLGRQVRLEDDEREILRSE